MTKTIILSITLLLLTPGCQEPDSVLLANLNCDPGTTPSYSIQVMLSEPGPRNDTKIFSSNRPLHFSTSLALVIPRNHSGQLDLAFLALDANSKTTAHATAKITLPEGVETALTVQLSTGDNLCSNKIIDPGEECDDGNLFSFDGCDNNCQLESTSPTESPDAGTILHPDSNPSTPPPDTLPKTSPDAIPDHSPLLGPNGTPCTINSQNIPCLTEESPCILYSQCASWFCNVWASPSTCTPPAALGTSCTASAQCGSGCCEKNQCVPYTYTCPT
jgi:cysteine-rich repeat protein